MSVLHRFKQSLSTADKSLFEGEADDGGRTRDLELGKLALYQLSYVRVGRFYGPGGDERAGIT
jgi:hypothetical protein